MKLLFLDVDGVLNCRADFEQSASMHVLNNDKLLLLKRIVDQTGCAVVLSSSWRSCNHARKILENKLWQVGIDLLGTTPDRLSTPRALEILQWVRHNKITPTKAVVLDDDVDAAVREDGWMFAHTSFSTGLTEELTNQIIEFLWEK